MPAGRGELRRRRAVVRLDRPLRPFLIIFYFPPAGGAARTTPTALLSVPTRGVFAGLFLIFASLFTPGDTFSFHLAVATTRTQRARRRRRNVHTARDRRSVVTNSDKTVSHEYIIRDEIRSERPSGRTTGKTETTTGRWKSELGDDFRRINHRRTKDSDRRRLAFAFTPCDLILSAGMDFIR